MQKDFQPTVSRLVISGFSKEVQVPRGEVQVPGGEVQVPCDYLWPRCYSSSAHCTLPGLDQSQVTQTFANKANKERIQKYKRQQREQTSRQQTQYLLL